MLFYKLKSVIKGGRREISTRLTARFSHELRTQLTGIVGYAEFLENGEGEPMTSFTAKIIRESGENVTQIVGAYCDLNFLVNGNIRLTSSRFNMSELVKEVVRESKENASVRHIELSFACVNDLAECCVSADVGRVRQALTSLMSGTVALLDDWSSVRVVLKANPKNDGLFLEFHFSDVAAKSSQMPLYQAFWRDASYEFRLQEGPGVVLAIARELLLFMNCSAEYFYDARSKESRLVLDMPFRARRGMS